MKRLILLPLFFIATLLSAKDEPVYPVSDIPVELLINAHTIVRDEQYKVDIGSIRDFETKHFYAVTLLSDKSTGNRYRESYDQHSKIIKLKAKIYDANGKLVREIKKNEIKDVSAVASFSIYEDDRIKYIDVGFKQYPYTIVFECVKKHKGTLFYPGWRIQKMNQAVQKAFFEITLPSDLDIQYKVSNTDIEPIVQDGIDKKTFHWEVTDLQAKNREEYQPTDGSVLPAVLISPNQFQFGNFIGDMTSWETYSTTIYELNKNRDILSPEMQNTIKELIASAETTKEKIDTLYRYLQENMRYVSVQLGIGGWQTFDARYVEKNKYGDCKALSNFMKAMLKEAGIESVQALVFAGQQKVSYDKNFVYPMFNHVILYVPEEDYWLECTNKSSPPNYIESFTGGREVLLVRKEGGRLVKTPSLGAAGNRQISQVKVALQVDGTALVKNTIIRKGSLQRNLRNYSSLTDRDQRTALRRSGDLPNGDIKSVSIQADYFKPTTSLNYEMEVPNYAAKAGRRLFVPLNPLNIFDEGITKDYDRQYPIAIDKHYAQEDVYWVDIPEGYEIESQFTKLEPLNSPFGSYELKVEIKGQQLICTRRLEIKPVLIPATRFEEVRDFYNQIIKKDKMKLVLVKKKT